jgi:hypothetical protein
MLLKELLKAIQPVEVAGDSDIECAAHKPTATPTYLLP